MKSTFMKIRLYKMTIFDENNIFSSVKKPILLYEWRTFQASYLTASTLHMHIIIWLELFLSDVVSRLN